MKITEQFIERKLIKAVKQNKGKAIKFISPYYTGMPDRFVIFPGNKFGLAELKKPGKTPSPRQRIVHQELKALGVVVEVIDSVEAINPFIDKILNS